MSDRMDLLREAAGEDCFCERESMKKHTTFRIGGAADLFAAPTTVEGICGIVRVCREQGYPFYVIGNGSNLLVSDLGYRGLVLQLYKNFSKTEIYEENETGVETPPHLRSAAGRRILFAQSGAMLSVIAKRALDAGLTGFEFAAGIPGTLGGAVVMNAGAYGGEMKDVLVSATVLTRDGEILEIPVGELALGYRRSAVASNGWIVLGARLALSQGNPEEIRSRMEELRQRRTQKQPLDLPSAGSTFKRPEGYFAGKLIMDAGLKGYTVGGAQVSEKHCGFVVNRGDATASDVLRLIMDVRCRVQECFDVTLEPEIKLLGEFK